MCASSWHPCLFAQAVACIALTALSSCPARAADWKERLLTEAPPKWAALEQYYAKMEASYREVITEKPRASKTFPEFQDSGSVECRKNGPNIVYTGRSVGKSSTGERIESVYVRGFNSRYFFSLGKTSPDAESFILRKFEPAHDEEWRKAHGGDNHDFGNVYEVNSWSCDRLSEFIKNPYVTITDVRGMQRGGRELALLSYERLMEKTEQDRGLERGTVVLDPEHCWCVRESHADLPYFIPVQKTEVILEYGDDVEGFPILRRTQSTTTYRDGHGKLVTITEFDKLIHRDIPESEFTLSAFGMPEIPLPGEQKPNTLWRWLLGIGIALGVMAVLLRVYVKKRQGRLAT